MKTTFTRSVGEITRSVDEPIFLNRTDNNFFELFHIANTTTLTIIESEFSGMVGETIIVYSYHTTDYMSDGSIVTTPIKTLEEFKELYKNVKGKRTRIKLWRYMKNFNGWSEDPRPYVI